ncbi:glycosyltransferase [Spongisporangium articulatum]|uniref:Glycosyltransferase n=1 Tax=Spongisporangium articulatum TaxID=3362603 RepID=A0ABW8ARL1_9ACTN
MSDLSVRPELESHADAGGPRRLRVAVVAETFETEPLRPGFAATRAVVGLLEHLRARGHNAVLLCPAPAGGRCAPGSVAGAPVVTVPGVRLSGVRVGLPTRTVMRTLASFAPDVVHLASPVLLGAAALTAAGQLGVPTLAVCRDDDRARLVRPLRSAWQRRVHSAVDLTLVGSSAGLARFAALGVPRVAYAGLGVDGDRFHPGLRAGEGARTFRARWDADESCVVIGHDGAPELGFGELPGVRSVVVGDSPQAFAALDLYLGTGADAPGVLRALASGVPVVRPAGPGEDVDRPRPDGLLHDGTARGLTRCVRELVDDADRRRWAGLAARSGFERRAAQAHGDEVLARYRELITLRNAGQ